MVNPLAHLLSSVIDHRDLLGVSILLLHIHRRFMLVFNQSCRLWISFDREILAPTCSTPGPTNK
jgi:hypothetical protein